MVHIKPTLDPTVNKNVPRNKVTMFKLRLIVNFTLNLPVYISAHLEVNCCETC